MDKVNADVLATATVVATAKATATASVTAKAAGVVEAMNEAGIVTGAGGRRIEIADTTTTDSRELATVVTCTYSLTSTSTSTSTSTVRVTIAASTTMIAQATYSDTETIADIGATGDTGGSITDITAGASGGLILGTCNSFSIHAGTAATCAGLTCNKTGYSL